MEVHLFCNSSSVASPRRRQWTSPADAMRTARTWPLLSAFQGLNLCTSETLQSSRTSAQQHAKTLDFARRLQNGRQFSTTSSFLKSWLEVNARVPRKKTHKGRVHLATGGSTKGTTVVWGDWGLRMADYHRRISAKQLKTAEETIKLRLRGQAFRLYTRKCCNVGVYTSGNEVRMGKGKGSFDHWAARVSVKHVVFELKGKMHEQVIRDAFRLAGKKLPGKWEIVKKGTSPYVGIIRLDGVTLEELKQPRRYVAPASLLEASSPSSVTDAGSTSEASRSP